jgi:hypothetical protein
VTSTASIGGRASKAMPGGLARFGPAKPTGLARRGNDAIIRSYDPTVRVETRDWGGSVDLGGGLAVHLTPRPRAGPGPVRRDGRSGYG